MKIDPNAYFGGKMTFCRNEEKDFTIEMVKLNRRNSPSTP